MENNELIQTMDVKLSINDKRSETLKLKTWTRCQVKIQAIKCLPCFLRITFTPCSEDGNDSSLTAIREHRALTVSVIVPGVSVSLAESRFKQFSYGLLWTQNRRDCFIYLALETEDVFRQHMKWVRKSIKNLELYRQLFLEQHRNSRGPGRFGVHAADMTTAAATTNDGPFKTAPLTTLGPLPQIPDTYDGNSSSWSTRFPRVSGIYEEIAESHASETPNMARRSSRTSVASGIYEEMKATSSSNFNSIAEELLEPPQTPPTPPPLPPQRKRINTYMTDQMGLLGEIPRSNTNPESELAKKKKYKLVLDNIFGSARSKRAKSVSESHACTAEDVIDCSSPLHGKRAQSEHDTAPIYMNDAVATAVKHKRPQKMLKTLASKSKRNSFSSPDLSKVGFLDSFDEPLDNDGSDESQGRETEALTQFSPSQTLYKPSSMESLNVSQQISYNFNFSACNTSTINLVGANGATPAPLNPLKNKIELDDLTGYCIMAPIRPKKPITISGVPVVEQKSTKSTSGDARTSSGYASNGSQQSNSTSSTNSTEEQVPAATPTEKPPTAIAEESVIYEHMVASSRPSADDRNDHQVLDFTGNLYENLLAIKAAQELQQSNVDSPLLTTSTPTESPHTLAEQQPEQATKHAIDETEEEENYYQTPRKSIISVDEKIPSYYPNSCDTVRMRRGNQSPTMCTPTSTVSRIASNGVNLRQLMGMKMRRGEHKENIYISSPQQIIEQRHKSISAATINIAKTPQRPHSTKTAARKISENVYAVRHLHDKIMGTSSTSSSNSNKNSNNNNSNLYNNNRDCINTDATNLLNDQMREQLQKELLQLTVLQNIDFKFDDAKLHEVPVQSHYLSTMTDHHNVTDEENFYQSIGEHFAAPKGEHQLQVNQQSNIEPAKDQIQQREEERQQQEHLIGSPIVGGMTQSKLESSSGDLQCGGSAKKFSSLPRFKKFDFSALKLKIHNALQRNQQNEF